MNKKLTSSFFSSSVNLFFSLTNLIFHWSIDDPSLNSSLLLQFPEGIMRPYHSSNKHRHFNKSNIMNVLRHYSPRLKKNLTFHDTNIYKNDKNYSCTLSIFNETHIFRNKYSLLTYTEKRREEKNWIWAIILATQNSMNRKNVCWLIIRITKKSNISWYK